MEHTFNITVSQRDADVALRRFIFREAGWATLIAASLCLGYIVYDSLIGDIGHLSIAIISLLLLMVIVYCGGFIIRRKQTASLLKRLEGAPITYRFDETEMSTESALGSSTLKWEMIKKLWIDPDLILVFYARNGYTTIPTSQIPDDALEFLVTRTQESRGSIIDKRSRG